MIILALPSLQSEDLLTAGGFVLTGSLTLDRSLINTKDALSHVMPQCCTGSSEAGGGGLRGFSTPNNLLKFFDFVSEKAVKAKVVRIFKRVYIRGSHQNLSKIQRF